MNKGTEVFDAIEPGTAILTPGPETVNPSLQSEFCHSISAYGKLADETPFELKSERLSHRRDAARSSISGEAGYVRISGKNLHDIDVQVTSVTFNPGTDTETVRSFRTSRALKPNRPFDRAPTLWEVETRTMILGQEPPPLFDPETPDPYEAWCYHTSMYYEELHPYEKSEKRPTAADAVTGDDQDTTVKTQRPPKPPEVPERIKEENRIMQQALEAMQIAFSQAVESGLLKERQILYNHPEG